MDIVLTNPVHREILNKIGFENIKKFDTKGSTLLTKLLGVANKYPDFIPIFKEYCEKNPDQINIVNIWEYTALQIAVYANDAVLCEILLMSCVKYGIDIDGTALHIAIKRSYLNLVKLLLKFKFDLNIKNKKGNTALHLIKNNFELAKLLLKNNASIHLKNNKNEKPLYAATRNEMNLEIVKLFFEYDSVSISKKWHICKKSCNICFDHIREFMRLYNKDIYIIGYKDCELCMKLVNNIYLLNTKN